MFSVQLKSVKAGCVLKSAQAIVQSLKPLHKIQILFQSSIFSDQVFISGEFIDFTRSLPLLNDQHSVFHFSVQFSMFSVQLRSDKSKGVLRRVQEILIYLQIHGF